MPFLIVHGLHDDLPVQMSRNLLDALTAENKEVVYAELPTGHMGVRDNPLTWHLVDAFLARHLQSRQ